MKKRRPSTAVALSCGQTTTQTAVSTRQSAPQIMSGTPRSLASIPDLRSSIAYGASIREECRPVNADMMTRRQRIGRTLSPHHLVIFEVLSLHRNGERLAQLWKANVAPLARRLVARTQGL